MVVYILLSIIVVQFYIIFRLLVKLKILVDGLEETARLMKERSQK